MRWFTALAFIVALLVSGCGESQEVIAARETAKQAEAARKAERDQVLAAQAAYTKYLDDCQKKHGDKHWGPFTGHSDYRMPHDWYTNGRFRTVKHHIANATDRVWDQAKEKRVCVVAEVGSYGVSLSLEDGSDIKITRRVRTEGVARKDWPTNTTTVKSRYIKF